MTDSASAEEVGEPRRHWTRFVLWHAAASALALWLVALRYFQTSSWPGDLAGGLFVALAAPGHFFGLALLAALPVLLAARLRPGRWLVAASVALQAALLLAVAVDSQVYALYRSHIDGMVLALLGSGLGREILQPNASDAADLTALAAGALLLQAGLAWLARAIAGRARWRPVWLLGLLLPFVAAQAMHAWADAVALPSVTRAARVLPWLPAATAKRWLAARGWVATRGAPSDAIAAPASDLVYPLAPPDCRTEARAARILVIVIEEWRADELDPETTPNLWRFAADSMVFERHFSAGSTSRYGVFGLFYGLHGDYWDAMLAEQRGPLLVDEMLRRSARFFIAASAPLARPEFDRTAFAALRGRVPFVQPTGATSERDREITTAFTAFAADVARQSRARGADEPFFAVLYYDSPHSMDVPEGWPGPHQPARAWGSRLALDDETDPAPLWRAHANSVHYVDSLVGEALDALRRGGLLESTAVVIAGDHGEEFNDLGLGYWGHNGNFGRFQTQVGMVLKIPGRAPARVDALTSHVDVVPTLMREVLACQAEVASYSNGQPLVGAARARDYVVASGGSLGVGIIESERITTIDRLGEVTVLGSDLRRDDRARPDRELLRRVFAELAAFRGGAR